MHKILVMAIVCMSSIVYAQRSKEEGMPVQLACEHLVNPLGVDQPKPRLSWKLDDIRMGAKQSAYQLFVDSDSLLLAQGHSGSWDSGKQLSPAMLVFYGGRNLKPQSKYFWRVRTWDKDGIAHTSSIASFETGMLGMDLWKGKWIGDKDDIHEKRAPYFRRSFRTNKPIRSARVYIAAAGLYELSVNGKKIGDHRLDPMYTRFDKRTLYVVEDVTHELQSGANVMGVILGNGWYNHQPLAVWDFDKAPWRNRPTFCLDLRIIYTDGSEETIASDDRWKTSFGPLLYNNLYTGEHYDARLEIPGWDTPRFAGSGWHKVQYRTPPSSNMVSQLMAPIRLVRSYEPRSVQKIDAKTYVFDMGQNMAGITKLRVKGKEGTVLHIKHGERLYPDGRLDQSNIDVYYRGDKELEPFQTDILILSGKKEDEFMSKFSYKGFRYVEINSNEPIQLDKSMITAYFMHSDVRSIGQLKTSSRLINSLWEATNNAYLSNLMGYPTDCPQREKNGWTGDGHLAIETAFYNFDGITVYEKWLADHRDEQQENGVLPDIIPTGGWGYGTANGLDWTSTIAIIPWETYLFYGDSKMLADCYDHIKRYVDYVDSISPTGLTTFGRGDWVPVKSQSNLELTSSVYFYVDAKILASAAEMFGKQEDHRKYQALSRKIKDAINGKFLDVAQGIYSKGTQTELSVPLFWGVVPEEVRGKVAANLNSKVEETNFHLDVGVLGAKALLNALKDNGYGETAYRVAVQDTYPSWGWWIVNGATTLLENWDLKATRDISDNHMMFGEIGGWFFKSIGGILPDPEQPGFKHVLLKPIFPAGLQQSSVTYESPYGQISSRWKVQNKKIIYDIEIPANATATFYPPKNIKNKDHIPLEAGKHSLELEFK
ncbi:family 78 glycoside hydrolase catalytic domain [Sphingobacterium sp. N143]|uniref:alpha-L-rhamnosidase n=1 Tax=Sphingobacterium sp. N143 TaxID=2746727 RepID=UPI00257720C2|nr:alpha-L-rhamnosidase [Sphingobacterium sp. N143]MDM1293085.1 family 78 glycoside hydrolase catalytic domain [Sphingobacterium sp. N143]